LDNEKVKESVDELTELKKHLWCLNDTDYNGQPIHETEFYGPDDGSSHRRLDIIYQPCTPEKITEDNMHLVNEKCMANFQDMNSLQSRLKKSINYLGDPVVKIYHNRQRVSTSQENYGDKAIKSESKILSK
jgi:hypothetical protein